MNSPSAENPNKCAAVTIIVPAYNHANYIVEALDSVRAQTISNWEMIVIDDGSTDSTWAVVTAYQERIADPRIRVIRQENAGSHATINRGMNMATTPYLAILNSDDIYAPDRLEKLLNISASRASGIFVVTGVRLIDEKSASISELHWWQSMYGGLLDQWDSFQRQNNGNVAVQTLMWGNFTISTSNFFMSRGIWELIGPFRPFRYVPDWDFALRVAAEKPGAFIFASNEELLSYRLHGRNTILGGALRNHAEAVSLLRSFQKKWVAGGHRISPLAIDRLHYLNRFMRHEHTRQMLEAQKTGWVEQVEALRSALGAERVDAAKSKAESDRWQEQASQARAESEQWQQQAIVARADSEQWQQQAILSREESRHWQQESMHWQQEVGRLHSTVSWRLTAPLRYVKRSVRASLNRSRQLLRRIDQRAKRTREAMSNPYQNWMRDEMVELTKLKANSASLMSTWKSRPLISVIVPVHNTPAGFLRDAVESVRAQWYENWEICLCNDASERSETLNALRDIEKSDPRIQCVNRSDSGHIVLATNDAIKIATGDFVVFLDHDDQLAPHALYMLTEEINRTPDADLIYSDEDKIDERLRRSLPLFKPGWSPVLQWSQNYIGHVMCVRKALLDDVGGLLPGTQGSQDHDLVLRLAANGAKFVHVPHILYHWRIHPASTASNPDAKPYAHVAGKEAVGRHLQGRYGQQFDRMDDGDYPFVYQPRFRVSPAAMATIIIPTRDKPELLKACIDSIQQETVGTNYEIVVLDNGSIEQETTTYFQSIAQSPKIHVVKADVPFNWSVLNNLGRSYATGEVLVFLNNDTTVISPDWLQRLMEYALLPDVATVGPLLLYPDGTIQHAGVVVGMGGWADHVFKGERVTHYPTPFVSSVVPRNVLANTGACLAIATECFDKLGGFDEAFQICGSDVELGIRAHMLGYFNVYLPTVRLFHLESKTRSPHVPAIDFEQSDLKYAPYRLNGDPFYNRNLDLARSSPTPRYPADKIIAST